MLPQMPRTHAVDLDGTLAKYDGWKGALVIGEPVPAMVKRVKDWIKAGDTVIIFTARADQPEPEAKMQAVMAIQAWSQKNIGQILEITSIKSARMTDFWDDRAVAVENNTGKPL